MSLRLSLINRWLHWVEKPRMARAKTPDDLRRPLELQAKYLFKAPRGSSFRADHLCFGGAEIPALWAENTPQNPEAVLLYFHGGAYIFGSPRTHRAMLARLAKLSGMPACLPQYRLAPENVFPAAVEDALAAYQALLARGIQSENIILGGDSAGGGLALALLAEILAQGLPVPAGLFAFSPLTDQTYSSASFSENAKAEAVLPAARAHELGEMYLAGAAPKDPRASPLFASFEGAPPVWLTVGDTEILLDDSRRMRDQLQSQGVDVTLEICPDHPHVWPIFQWILPEAISTLETLADWIKPLLPSPPPES